MTEGTQTGQPERSRLVISDEDLASTSVEDRVNELKRAAAPPLVQSVGTPTTVSPTAGSWWRKTAVTLAIAGTVGGFVGFVLSELLTSPDAESTASGNVGLDTAIWVALFAIGLGAVMAAWEGIEIQSGEKVKQALIKTLPAIVAGGAVAGFLAQTAVYEPILDSAYDRALDAGSIDEAWDIMMSAVRFGRALGFMLVGAAMGAALGAGARSSKKALNGAMGGAIGGFIGGFIFDWIGETLGAETGAVSRAVVMILTGLIIGAAIGLIENARKDHWLEIVSGGMAGKQFILYHDETVIGSDASCGITLIKDPQISPRQALLKQNGQGATLQSLDQARPVLINGAPATNRQLVDGDLIQAGQTVVRYGQRDQATPTLAYPSA